MKTKLLTACVAAALLAGCGSDGKDPQQQVQAYDGAIRGIEGTYSCTADGVTETGTLPKTAYSGFSTVTTEIDSLLFSNPSSCTFTFNPTEGAVDVSNGKSMADVSLSIPRGLATSGSKIAATPFTSLVAQTLNGADYTEAAATQVLKDLGLDGITNNTDVTVADLMTDLEGAIAKLKNSADENTKKLAGQLTATTHVLTDVLVKKGTLTSTETAVMAKNLAATVTSSNPFYPAAGATGTGGNIVVDVKATVDAVVADPTTKETMTNPATTIDDIPEEVKAEVDESATPAKPVDPTQPPTGTGTGGGNGGSTGV
ncbi:hypothetical protein [Vibrio navarrensis]|uniref:hypothetical protein n=1 Tax=Vibrio navarrensis TaxID=29495 RepID=UPI0018DBA5A3|nr:hypothetical protein [Vibrio navarrensis]MBH9739854.1 hypothetical protein [Vibrio navarrensis]